MNFRPIHFFGEPVEVMFDNEPVLLKKTGCPDSFRWRDETFHITEVLSEWHDYHRRGRMARNMAPAHAGVAENRGSWGVGQDFFRIRTEGGRYFDIYYDRAPHGIDHRLGGWFIYRELQPDEPSVS